MQVYYLKVLCTCKHSTQRKLTMQQYKNNKINQSVEALLETKSKMVKQKKAEIRPQN